MIRKLFSKPLLPYTLGLFMIMFCTGILLRPFVTHFVYLIVILLVGYVAISMLLLHIYDHYMVVLGKASRAISQLESGQTITPINKGSKNEIVNELERSIQTLANNLYILHKQERTQAEQFSTVIDHTESGLILIDSKGVIHLVNRKGLDMFGKSSKDYIGKKYDTVFENEMIHQTIQQTFLTETRIKKSFVNQKGVHKTYLEIVCAPIFNDTGALRGAVLVVYDITELKNLERMRKDFVANVSHELKTPITSIRGFSETLIEGAMDHEETRAQFIGIIHEESKRLQVLIEDLLVLSKIEQEKFEPNLTEVDIEDVLSNVVPLIDQLAHKKNIDFSIKAEENLLLTVDSAKMKQVLINLLSNAIEYTPEDGTVCLVIAQNNDWIRIEVQDTGMGIGEKDASRIFERFYRVDKARSRNTGGTGLGLAIVKHIVELHAGEITVDSMINHGTTFRINLPK